MHTPSCSSKAHLEKYSRRSMERAMTSASLFQSCSEYLCALERIPYLIVDDNDYGNEYWHGNAPKTKTSRQAPFVVPLLRMS